MLVRSILLCEDLRFETSGQITAVGIFGEVFPVAWVEDRLVQPRLVLMIVVSGLRGQDEVEYQLFIDPDEAAPTHLLRDRHDARYDHHILVCVREPMVYAAPGRHVARLRVRVGPGTLTYEYPFEVQGITLGADAPPEARVDDHEPGA